MGQQVLALLKSRHALPEQGYLAGQAVLSALLELHGDGQRRGPYNDIDIFRPVAQTRMTKVSVTDARGRQMTWNEPASAWPDWTREATRDYLLGRARGFVVVDTCREAEINFVDVCTADAQVGLELPVLLQGFDFNMVAVGVDCASGRMAWTEGFESFWGGGRVQLQDVPAPHVALPRLLKKVHEMPWLNVDVEDLARDCMVIMSALKHQARHGVGYVSRPPKYIEMLDRHDPERRYPRMHEWQRGEVVPRGWRLSDFSPLQQDLLMLVQDAVTVSFGAAGNGGVVSHPVASAAALGRIDILHRLVERGFDVHGLSSPLCSNAITSRSRLTPLEITVSSGARDGFYELLKLGARPAGQLDEAFRTLLEVHDALKTLRYQPSAVPRQRLDGLLLTVAQQGATVAVHELLQAGADIEARDVRGRTPFMQAAAAGHTGLCLRLAQEGARIDARDKKGLQAADLAEAAHVAATAHALRALAAQRAADAALQACAIAPRI